MKIVTCLAAAAAPLGIVSAVEIIAHRGASHDAPENTIAAFKLGWEQKADADELDIHLTKDGRIVVLHDPKTKRVSGIDGEVKARTFAELRALDVGSWKGPPWKGEKIPALEEVLATIPESGAGLAVSVPRLFIEIKCGPEVLPELARVLQESGKRPEQLAIIGFDYATMKAARAQFPDLQLYWLVSPKKESRGLIPPVDELIAQAQSARFDGLNLNYQFAIDQAFVARVKAAGLKLYVWTVNDAVIARHLAKLGVDGITTDRPGWLREQVALPRQGREAEPASALDGLRRTEPRVP